MRRSRGTALLGWVVMVAIAGVAIGATRPAARSQTPAQQQQGALLYQQQCTQCHGGDGRGALVPGTGRRAPALRGLEVAYVDLVLRTGRMPPAGDPFDNRSRQQTVTGEAREALVAWMAGAFALTGTIPQATAGEVSRGLEVYQQQCAHCHGGTGAGGVAGAGAYTPSLTGYDPVVIAEAIRVGPFDMPRFSQQQITSAEVNAIAGYLAFVEAEPRSPLFGLLELNPVYAAGFVALATLVLVLSLFWIGGTPALFPDPRKGPAQKEPRE